MKQLFTLVCFLFISQSLRADCWKTVSAGDYFSLGIQSDGSLWAWGKNTGNAIFADSNRYNGSYFPVRIGTDSYWRAVSAGQDHILGIRTDGSLWAWGSNSYGKIGNGTSGFFPVKVPTRIGSDTDWVAVSAGDNHSVALKSNGSLWAWGFNLQGALGDSTKVDKHVPTRIGTGTSWKSISAGKDYTMAIQANGSLWGWGYNNGRLGDGQVANTIVPGRIGLDSNWRIVEAGSIHTMAIKTDSSLWATGTGSVLGNGMSYSRSMVPVDTGHYWHSVTLGAYYTMALRANGTLWGWGTTYSATPAQIGTASNWTVISARNKHTLGMASDNSIWAWGWNIEGQVGDSTTTDRPLPVIVSKCTVTPLSLRGAPTTRESFAIYPNPVRDVLKVLHAAWAPIGRMEIMDISGRSNPAPLLSPESVRTEHLAPGMYLLRIYSGEGQFSYRFVKE